MHGHRGAVHVQLPHDGGAALQPCLPGLGAARAPPQPQQAHLQRTELSDTGVGIGRAFARACRTKQADWPASEAEGTPDLWRIGLDCTAVRPWPASPAPVPRGQMMHTPLPSQRQQGCGSNRCSAAQAGDASTGVLQPGLAACELT